MVPCVCKQWHQPITLQESGHVCQIIYLVMLQDFVKKKLNAKKLPQNAKLYHFEKIPNEINDTKRCPISTTVSLITLQMNKFTKS